MKIQTREDHVEKLLKDVELLNNIVENQSQVILDLLNQQGHIMSWSRGATKLLNDTAANVKAIENTLIKEITK